MDQNNQALVKIAQSYGIKHWLSTPLAGTKRVLLEKFFSTFKEHMMELRAADDKMRSIATAFKTYLRNAEKAFKRRQYIDVAHWVGQINKGSHEIIELSRHVANLKDDQLAEHFGEYSDADLNEEYFKNAEALLRHEYLIKNAGFLEDVFKGVSRRFLESLYWKDTKERKKTIETLLDDTEYYIEKLNKSLNKMGYARSGGNVSDWIKESNDIVKAHSKFEAKFKQAYDSVLLPLIQNVKLRQQEASKLQEQAIKRQEEAKGEALTEAEKASVRQVVEDAVLKMQEETATPGQIETAPELNMDIKETPQEVRKQYLDQLVSQQQEEEHEEPIPLTREKEEEPFPLIRQKEKATETAPLPGEKPPVPAPAKPATKPSDKKRGRPSKEETALKQFEKALRENQPSEEDLRRANEEQIRLLKEKLNKEDKATQKLEEAEIPVTQPQIEKATEEAVNQAKKEVKKEVKKEKKPGKEEKKSKKEEKKEKKELEKAEKAEKKEEQKETGKSKKPQQLTLLVYPKEADIKEVSRKLKEMRKDLSHRVESVVVDKAEHVKKMFENQKYDVEMVSFIPPLTEEMPKGKEPEVPLPPAPAETPAQMSPDELAKTVEEVAGQEEPPAAPEGEWTEDKVFEMYSAVVNKFGNDFLEALPKDAGGNISVAKLMSLPGINLLSPSYLRLLFGLDRKQSERVKEVEPIPLTEEEADRLMPMFDAEAWQKGEEAKVANLEALLVKEMNARFMEEVLKISAQNNPYLLGAVLAKYSEVMEQHDPKMSVKLLTLAQKLINV